MEHEIAAITVNDSNDGQGKTLKSTERRYTGYQQNNVASCHVTS